jgi:hypothetical protein
VQAALTAAGTGAQIIGQQKSLDAQSAASEAERLRQEAFEQNIRGQTNDITDATQVGGFQEDIVRGDRRATAKRTRAKAREPNIRSALPGGSRASRAVKSTGRADAASGKRRNARVGRGISRAAGFRSAKVSQNSAIQRAFSGIQRNTVNARNSANVLPLELSAASQVGSKTKTIGDVLLAAATLSSAGSGFANLFASTPQTAGNLAAFGPRTTPRLRPPLGP